jgi:hypothetical protein
MSDILKETIIRRVRRVNNTLLNMGYNWDEIEAFWRECIAEGRKRELEDG